MGVLNPLALGRKRVAHVVGCETGFGKAQLAGLKPYLLSYVLAVVWLHGRLDVAAVLGGLYDGLIEHVVNPPVGELVFLVDCPDPLPVSGVLDLLALQGILPGIEVHFGGKLDNAGLRFQLLWDTYRDVVVPMSPARTVDGMADL